MTNFPEVKTEPVCWGGNHVDCPDYQAIVNEKTGDTYAITSRKYNLMKHEDMLDAVEEAIEENPDFGNFEQNVWLSPNGGRMKTTYRFPDIEFPIVETTRDTVNPTIEVFNSYDLSWPRKVLFGAFRLVCSNGLIIGKIFMNYRRKHTKQDIDNQEIKQILMGSMERFSDQTTLWKSWVDRVTTVEEYEKVMTGLDLGKKDIEKIGNEVEASSNIIMDDVRTKTLTYWLFYNILCQYITHKVESENKRVYLQHNMREYF